MDFLQVALFNARGKFAADLLAGTGAQGRVQEQVMKLTSKSVWGGTEYMQRFIAADVQRLWHFSTAMCTQTRTRARTHTRSLALVYDHAFEGSVEGPDSDQRAALWCLPVFPHGPFLAAKGDEPSFPAHRN